MLSLHRSSRHSLRTRLVANGFTLAVALIALGACSGESEGQRCSTTDDQGGANGTNSPPGSGDCGSGLYCYPVGSLAGAAALYQEATVDPSLGVCCPILRTQSTTAICALQPSPTNGDASIPGEAGPASDAGDAGDAGPSTDGGGPVEPSDSSSDAPSDAPTTG